MHTFTCPNCGAANDPVARFCRQCGRMQDSSELTTRELKEPQRFEAPTQPANSGFTAPAYLQPDPYSMRPPVTGSMEPSGQKKTIVTLSILIAVLLVAISGLAFYIIARNSPPPGAAVTIPQGGIPSPPPPPQPPRPTSGGRTLTAEELVYPGSKIVFNMTGKTEGKVLQLSTADGIDKVTQWYMDKINSKENVQIMGATTVIDGEGVAVVIAGGSNGTSITVTEDHDK